MERGRTGETSVTHSNAILPHPAVDNLQDTEERSSEVRTKALGWDEWDGRVWAERKDSPHCRSHRFAVTL